MTRKGIIFSLLVTFFLIIGSSSPALAAQISVHINPELPTVHPQLKFQRTVMIEYDEGGAVADALRGKSATMQFSADSSTPGVSELIKKLNDSIVNAGGDARITDLDLDYSVTLTGRALNTAIDYKVVLNPTLESFLIRPYSTTGPALIDVDWRGMSVKGPVIISTSEHGDVEINQPISFIKQSAPQVADKITGSEAEKLLMKNIIDSTGIKKQPFSNWHFLFDPTGINVDASSYGLSEEITGFVVSSFTMGESSLREGRQVEKIESATFTADKTYPVRSIESADNANFDVIGFANADKVAGSEVLGVSPRAPEGYATTSTGDFPVMIIYGMAGMAAAVAVGFFFMSSRKLKSEEGQGQRGIDPSQLRGVATSAGAGGYQTVRGEAQLKDSVDYEQTRSVYETEKASESANDTSSSKKGSMPKGWKPSN